MNDTAGPDAVSAAVRNEKRRNVTRIRARCAVTRRVQCGHHFRIELVKLRLRRK